MEDERALNAKREQFHVQMCSRVNELDASVEADRKDMLEWITNNSENFTRLKNPSKQYFPEICELFVCSRLKNTDHASGKNRFFYSLDFLPCIRLDYSTYKNEEIEYYDKELGIITYLESQFNVVFKITDCTALLKALDINAADLSIGNVYEKLRTLALQSWREVTMEVVEGQNTGFYHFAQKFDEIAAKLSAVLNGKLSSYGVTVSDVTVLKMSVPESVREQIRQNSYELKRESDRYKSEAKFAGIYLDQYRKKAEIQSTYGIQESLTEFEKDRALERYLARVNNERKPIVEEAHLEERVDDYALDKPVEPKAPTIAKPEKPSPNSQNGSLAVGVAIGIVMLIIGRILISLVPDMAALGNALFYAGIAVAVICIAALVIILVTYKRKSAAMQNEYEQKLKLYNDAQEQYKTDMDEYKKAIEKYKASLAAKDKKS